MAKLNIPRHPIYTHGGAKASHVNAEQQLRRSVMSCLLWEQEFYEDGEDIATRIASLVPQVDAQIVSTMAIEARTVMKLRHAPLFLARVMAETPSHKPYVARTLAEIIQRPDELTEFLAIYWKDGKRPLSAQVKKGLASAFRKFTEYQLAKYNRDGHIKLRDVLFLSHPKPKDQAQDALWKRLIDGKLAVPDTWEVELSKQDGLPKHEKWGRLLRERKLGALALLRNLRNMQEAGVDTNLIEEALRSMNPEKVLPFRFVAAARHAPQWEPYLEQGMLQCLTAQEKFPGKTALLIDVSGSMDWQLSARSEMTRMDAACGLAVLAREVCETVDIFSFSNATVQIPPRHGFALRDALVNSQSHGATYLGLAIQAVEKQVNTYDRLIVLTDEQAHDAVSDPNKGRGYLINVASAKNGVGYGAWTHIDGWSEAVINYIRAAEDIPEQQ